MSGLFITSTGTDIGKTFVAVGLIRELRRRGRDVKALKPVVSGFEEWSTPASDPARLLDALDLPATPDEIARISPYRYRAPTSPEQAARLEGRTLDYDAMLAFCRAELAAADVLIVEGIGGVMVPLDGERTVLDWIADLKLPALVVAGNYLGTISHTLTALAALRHRRVHVAAAVLSEAGESPVPLADNEASIARFAHGTKVFALPPLEGGHAGAGHAIFGKLADLV
jgi:dethiobiotin synthetase